MPYRKQANQADSLELLLDTICNMFGGIVFISLLVVLMLQQSPETPAEGEAPDPIVIQKLEQDVSVARSASERSRQARAQQTALLAKYMPEDKQERIRELETIENENAHLEDRSLELGEHNLQQVQSLQKTQADLEHADQSLAELQARVQQLETDLSAAIEEQSVRLPQAKQVHGTGDLQVSVRYGRLYFRHDLRHLQSGNRVPNQEDYLVIYTPAEDVYEVLARPQAGIELAPHAQAVARLRQKLRDHPPARWSVSISLWPESFHSFRTLREILTELGYQFTVITPDNAVLDPGGEHRLFQ